MNLDNFADSEVVFEGYLGKKDMVLSDILDFEEGTIIDLDKPAGDPADIFISGRKIGKAEVMVYERNLALRITNIISSDEVFDDRKK